MKKRWMALLLALLMTLSMLPVSAMAEETGADSLASDKEYTEEDILTYGDCGNEPAGANVTYTIYKNGHMVIAGEGSMRVTYGGVIERREWHWCSDRITSLVVEEGITNLPYRIFASMPNLVSVKLPTTLSSIASELFSGCTSLKHVEITEGTTHIGSGAFSGCTSLEEIDLPDGITEIEETTFSGCTSLQRIGWPANLQRIGYYAFRRCHGLTELSLPDSLVYLSNGAFHDCDGLVSAHLSAGVEPYGNPFTYCDNLTTITVADGNPYVCAENNILLSADRKSLFCYPLGLPGTTYTVPAHVKTLETEAFAGSTKLTTVHIGDHVTGAGTGVFSGCTALTSMELPDSIGSDRGPYFSLGYMFQNCTALTSVRLPRGLSRLGGYIFGGCTALREVILPENLIEVSRNAFTGCTALTELELPDSVEVIDNFAFNDSGIVRLTIPASIQTIYSSIFNGTGKIIFEGGPPTNLFSEDSFRNADVRAYYPASCGWNSSNMLQYGGTVRWICGDGSAPEIGDNVHWFVENGVLTISGTGDMYDFGANGGPWAAQRDEITSVVIESGITSVGNYAFSNMGKITRVTMADTVQKIGEGAFYFCGRLASVTMPGVTAIGKQAFYSCDGLAAPVFPAGLTELAEGVYGGCAGFTEITIPEGITTIGAGAFEKCANLTTVSISASVTDIGDRPFDSCTKLTYIAADEDNTAFTAEDGILFNKGKTILLQVPAGKEKADYQVPETVIEIADHAFRMSKIHAIRFAGAAPVIGDHALESAFVQLRYPYDDESWYALLEQDYGAAELTWIPYHPGYGVDLNGSRLADLRDLDFMAFSQLAYHPYTVKEQDLSIGQLIHLLKDEVWSDRDITYTELTANIGNWVVADIFEDDEKGYYAVLFRNGYGEAVLAYRGSIALTKLFSDKASEQWDAVQDWLVNDFPMELGDYLVPQIDLALETLEEVLEDFTPDKLAATGHSLGGALSNIASTYSGCRSESVNAISSLDTVYAFKPGYMGENFKGVELWDIEDHANEHDILAGVFEDTFTYRIKPYTAHQSVFSSFNLTGNHGIASMLMRNELGGLIVTPQSGSFTPDGAITGTLLSSNYVLELGTAGADSMNAYSAQVLHHALYGGSGKDKLIGSMVADQLIGGPGNDSLDGGYGDDTYHYFKGHGTDTIHDVGGFDELCLYGFAAKEISVSSDGDYVEVWHNDQVIARIGRGSRSGRASDFVVKIYPDNRSGEFSAEFSLGSYFGASFSQRVAVGCPVDIEVLDSEGHVVYTVEDGTEGEYYTPYGSFYVYMEENGEYGKILDLKEGYTIRIKGLDEGTMEVTHWSADGDELTENGTAYRVPVREGFAAALTIDDLGVLSLTDDRGEEHPLIGSTDGEEIRDMEYTLHSLLVYTKEGVLSEIPAGLFNVSINMQNHASVTTDTLLLVLYDAEGRMIDLIGQPLTVKAGGTARPVLTLDNSDGEIAMIRAMVVARGGNIVPLSNAMTAGSILENLPEVPVVPEVPGVPEVPLGD